MKSLRMIGALIIVLAVWMPINDGATASDKPTTVTFYVH